MLPRAILSAVHEAHGLPVVVDRGALVIDEAGPQPDLRTAGEARRGSS
jgi:hypothetical protein